MQQRWAILPVYQPILRLDTGAVVAVEALSRFIGRGLVDARSVFAKADADGVRTELELTAIREAVSVATEIPTDRRLALNVSAGTLLHPDLARVLDGVPADRLIVELTHGGTAPFAEVRPALDAWRERGAQVALDDVGSATTSLVALVELEPDFVKCDMALVRGVDADPARAALIRALAGYAEAVDAQLVAKGIQSAAEAAALQAAGVRLGQGFALGRPETVAIARRRGILGAG